jgi:putative acetyltransferase
MALEIRYARAGDHPGIGDLLDAAFGGTAERHIVERLRADAESMFELVALQDGELAGSILFSRLWADSHNLYAALAPLAVRPDLQRKGIGAALTLRGLDAARHFDTAAVLVLGHPEYYPKFGFSAAATARVSSPYSGSPAFMGIALVEAALDEPLMVAYPDAFSAGQG